ncbi:MAG: hypothetical protein ABI137_03900 [Antricoccus sp.]
MAAHGQSGSIVILICDEGTRYDATYYNDNWVRERGFDLAPHTHRIDRAYRTGAWSALDRALGSGSGYPAVHGGQPDS